MEEIDRIHPGACIYTVSSVSHYKDYIAYMSNFNVMIFQLDPFRYVGTLTAPLDLQTNEGRETSGLTAMSINMKGQLAITTHQGNLFMYDINNLG